MKALEVLLSYACNEACAFCSQELSWRRAEGLPFPLVARELFKAAKDGYKSVCFTGGEPTLRKDLPQMAALARKLGFAYVRVQTNGLRFSEAGYAAELAGAGATHLRVSIHGPEADHDRLVKVPGAFARAAAGASAARAAGLGVGVNYVLNGENHALLGGFCRSLLDRGLSDLVVIYPLYEGDLVNHEPRMRLGLAEARAAVRAAAAVYAGRPGLRLLNLPPCAAPELTHLMLAWSPHSLLVVDEEGRPRDLYMASHDDRLQVPACGRCALRGECLGFKRSWLARFPDAAGAEPLREVPPPPRAGTRILRRGGGAFESGRHEIARAVQPVAGQAPGGAVLKVERMNVTLDAGGGRIVEERVEWDEPLGAAGGAVHA